MTVATERERMREPDPAALQYGRRPRPVCPDHGVEMKRGSTPAQWVYWYCPCPECWRSARTPR